MTMPLLREAKYPAAIPQEIKECVSCGAEFTAKIGESICADCDKLLNKNDENKPQ